MCVSDSVRHYILRATRPRNDTYNYNFNADARTVDSADLRDTRARASGAVAVNAPHTDDDRGDGPTGRSAALSWHAGIINLTKVVAERGEGAKLGSERKSVVV